MLPRKTVMVYIDGFSLYKGMLQRTFPEYKWLNLEALVERLFPRREVTSVKFFTALLKPLTNDPGVGQRQQVYWRALRTTGVEIVEGKFNFSKQYLPLHPEELDESGRVKTVQVKRPEEKGSDVALASHLIVDAMENRADSYALVTNDSDLLPPLQLLSARGKDLTLVSVANEKYNKAFVSAGLRSIRQIRRGTLDSSQFPPTIRDAEGLTIRKPPSWPCKKAGPPISRGPRPVAEASGWLYLDVSSLGSNLAETFHFSWRALQGRNRSGIVSESTERPTT